MVGNTSRMLLFVLSLLFLSGGRLHAEPARAGAQIDIGPFLSHITYQEPGIMEEDGQMRGLGASVSWHGAFPAGIDMIRIDALASFGAVDYSSVEAGSTDGIDYAMIETRALLGRELFIAGATDLSMFTGVGYRRLSDRSGGLITSGGYYGYDRVSNYFYLPLGLAVASKLGRGWSLDGVLEYDYLVRGIQKSQITDAANEVYSYSNDLSNAQESGYGLHVSARLRRRLGSSGSVAIGPFLRYWNIGVSSLDDVVITNALTQSSSRQSMVEPKNSTTEYGLMMSLLF
ncbi:MAG: hypothetical protein HGB29_05780 [Chlorobiaceae bacterium]|nr:hypothetical protein [Chlorobiaceae bacterium]